MLDAIGDAVETVVDFLDTIWKFVKDFTKSTFEMIELVGDTVKSIPDYFDWLPAGIVTSLVVLFGVVVIYKILGREG